jgi:NADH-quinone oxidoreductase subunit M
MPLYGGLAVGIFFAGMGLPGLCGFWGEAFSVLATWNYSPLYAIIAASGVILTAGYILWTVQRVYLGAEYKGPHPEAITPITDRETIIGGILLALCIVMGIFPNYLFDKMQPTVDLLVKNMNNAEGIVDAARQMSGL